MQICSSCKQDTAGNHEWDCPNNPMRYSGATGFSVFDVYGLKNTIWKLEKKLTIATAALKEIQEHEHCDARKAPADDLPIGYRILFGENEVVMVCMGIAAGHRCAAEIARRALDQITNKEKS